MANAIMRLYVVCFAHCIISPWSWSQFDTFDNLWWIFFCGDVRSSLHSVNRLSHNSRTLSLFLHRTQSVYDAIVALIFCILKKKNRNILKRKSNQIEWKEKSVGIEVKLLIVASCRSDCQEIMLTILVKHDNWTNKR